MRNDETIWQATPDVNVECKFSLTLEEK